MEQAGVDLRRKQVQKTQQPNKVQTKRVLGTQAGTPGIRGTLETQALHWETEQTE